MADRLLEVINVLMPAAAARAAELQPVRRLERLGPHQLRVHVDLAALTVPRAAAATMRRPMICATNLQRDSGLLDLDEVEADRGASHGAVRCSVRLGKHSTRT